MAVAAEAAVLRKRSWRLLTAAGGVLAAATGAPKAAIVLQPVASGLSAPVALAVPGDGSGRLFIAEQQGRIRILDGGAVLPTPFLNITALVASGGERGLLGLAFHPDYATTGQFFVAYTISGGALVIARYAVSADPDVALPDGTVLLTIPHPVYANHNGGQLAFGPDGYLYVATGDGGGGGDPDGNGQDLGILLGKILRLDVDEPSLIPATNPFVDGDPQTRDEIWAYGLRNPWRFSFDRTTGDLLIGDVGQGCWEEVDLAPAGAGGLNFGWPEMEGPKCYDPSSCNPPPICGIESFEHPILTISHSGGDCAVIGGHRYRGAAIPSLAGAYLSADYCTGLIRVAREDSGFWMVEDPPLATGRNITSFGEDESGELWVVDAGGGVSRIVSAVSFSDDFEDGDAADWRVRSGAWGVEAGRLSSSGERRAEILAPAAPCALCSVEARIRIDAPGTDASLVGWRLGEKAFVELRLSESRDRMVLRQVRSGGAREKQIAWPVEPGTEALVTLVYDGREFQAFIDGSAEPVLRLKSGSHPAGEAGLRFRGRRGAGAASFDDVAVR